jgi:tripartite-type tricarboxylate transporter receptor subunit TctC
MVSPRRALAACALCLALLSVPAAGQPAASFYADKTIRIIVSSTPGGGYDQRARAMARNIGRSMSGSPSLVVQNMPGGIVAMNYTYNVAPRDGSLLCLFQRSVITAPIMEPSGIKFELLKFNWIGSFGPEVGVVLAWHTAPVKTTADMFTQEMIVGMPGAITVPTVINAMTGTRFKIIKGYPGTREIMLAMERGEVMGVGEASWTDVKATQSQWLKDGKVRVLLQIGMARAPDLPDVPLAREFAKSEQHRKVLDVFLSQRQLAFPVVMPPEVPQDRVELVRNAFMAMGRDPLFKEDMDKGKMSYDLTSGADAEAFIKSMLASLTPDVVKQVTELAGPAN